MEPHCEGSSENCGFVKDYQNCETLNFLDFCKIFRDFCLFCVVLFCLSIYFEYFLTKSVKFHISNDRIFGEGQTVTSTAKKTQA